jgi:hypothetical protein
MIRKLTLALAVAAVGAAFTLAAPSPTDTNPPQEKAAPAKATPLGGTVVSIEGRRVEIAVEGEKPTWVKKGAGIKVAGGLGKIVEVSATKVAFNTRKASTLKVGDKLSVEKGSVVPAGC